MTAQHVLVELGGDALRVVVRGVEAVDVLDEVDAEQEVVVGAEPVAISRRNSAAGGGQEIADRAAEERDEPATVVRESMPRWCSKSPTTACTATVGYSRFDRRGRVAQRLLAHVERHEARDRARVAQRVEQDARLVRRSRTELDERVGAA